MGKVSDDSIEVREGEEVAGKTIVGGRPLKRRKVKMNIPAGIEKTIYKASIDPEFRLRLFDDRMGAISEHGFKLTEVERTMLEAIPDERLALIIDQIRPEKHGKRKFMRAVATAVVTLATGTATVSCDEMQSGGIMPEDTYNDSDTPDMTTDADATDVLGIVPDVPEDLGEDVLLDTFEDGAVEGIMPDAPEDVSDALEDVDEDGDADDAEEGDVITDVGMESWGITPDE